MYDDPLDQEEGFDPDVNKPSWCRVVKVIAVEEENDGSKQ